MSQIKLVCFDMAGTTIQDKKEVEQCFSRACNEVGLITSEERILSLQGYAKKEVFRLLWSEVLGFSHSDLGKTIDNSYEVFCDILEKHYHEADIKPSDFALEIFDILKANKIKIALTTGFYRKVANIILEKLGWLKGLNSQYISISTDSIIDISVTPDEVTAGRPHPDMIHWAMENLGINDSHAVINIGDTPVDIEFGINANVKYALAVTNGTHTREQLEGLGAYGLLNDLSELKKYIQ